MAWVYRDKTALVTGASSGIGEVFARELASRGMDLVLVARSEDRLNEIAEDIRSTSGQNVLVAPADLGDPQAIADLRDLMTQNNITVSMLVNNAGFGTYGAFDEQDPAREHQEIMLNVAAVVSLTHAFLPGMTAASDGAVINVASVAAFQPTPFMTVYGATKAFVLSFSEALWAELKPKGIRVVALCPGPVDTAFFSVIKQEKLKSAMERAGNMMTSEEVVSAALKALDNGKGSVVPGRRNQIQTASNRFVPRSLVATAAAKILKPRGGRAN